MVHRGGPFGLRTPRCSPLEAEQGLEKLGRPRREQGRDGRKLGGKEGLDKECGKVKRGREGGFYKIGKNY